MGGTHASSNLASAVGAVKKKTELKLSRTMPNPNLEGACHPIKGRWRSSACRFGLPNRTRVRTPLAGLRYISTCGKVAGLRGLQRCGPLVRVVKLRTARQSPTFVSVLPSVTGCYTGLRVDGDDGGAVEEERALDRDLPGGVCAQRVLEAAHGRRGARVLRPAKTGEVCRVGVVLDSVISLGGQAPHVLRAHMGVHRTCGEPNEIELAPFGV